MTTARPKCCQVADEADTMRWDGFRWTVALYIDGTGAAEAPADFCPFCGEKLPPGPDKHHPMRVFAYDKPEELLELYDEAMKRAAEAERRADALAAALRRLRGEGRLTVEEAVALLPELGPPGPLELGSGAPARRAPEAARRPPVEAEAPRYERVVLRLAPRAEELEFVLRVEAREYASEEDRLDKAEFYYGEHACPMNLVDDLVEIRRGGDPDPHDVFVYVRHEPDVEQDAPAGKVSR